MYNNSNLIITAWLNNELIGITRSITDFCYACYLSDLAVKLDYQKQGIGKQLIKLTKKEIGKETALILLSASIAMEYYPKIGFEKIDNGFIIHRTK
jgi:predicted N-acetyltransferase YhbS